ncbi:MAG TPA: hypothetical protein VHQ45_00300, partial [Gemmatimonadaceae bacterium]|nr:hypothetical protein [Gemmatimonadaceae bacterium]
MPRVAPHVMPRLATRRRHAMPSTARPYAAACELVCKHLMSGSGCRGRRRAYLPAHVDGNGRLPHAPSRAIALHGRDELPPRVAALAIPPEPIIM